MTDKLLFHFAEHDVHPKEVHFVMDLNPRRPGLTAGVFAARTPGPAEIVVDFAPVKGSLRSDGQLPQWAPDLD